MPALIECVPNFSEGRDLEVIRQITAAIESVEGATLLHFDPGRATNRTVVTFAGAPEAVGEAAFRAIAAATELIDMRQHTGEHPRMGATDVCPLIPIAGISMDETAELARRLGERVGRELGIPVYLYEAAAIDRASSWFQFWRITLPQVAPLLLIAVLFRTIEAIKSFDLVMGMTGGGPGGQTELIAINLYRQAFQGQFRTGPASALAYIILIIIIAISNLYIRYLNQMRGED